MKAGCSHGKSILRVLGFVNYHGITRSDRTAVYHSLKALCRAMEFGICIDRIDRYQAQSLMSRESLDFSDNDSSGTHRAANAT